MRPRAPPVPALALLKEPLMRRFPPLPYEANEVTLQDAGMLLGEGDGGNWIAAWRSVLTDLLGGVKIGLICQAASFL